MEVGMLGGFAVATLRRKVGRQVLVLSSASWHSEYRAMRACPQYSTGQQLGFPWLAGLVDTVVDR